MTMPVVPLSAREADVATARQVIRRPLDHRHRDLRAACALPSVEGDWIDAGRASALLARLQAEEAEQEPLWAETVARARATGPVEDAWEGEDGARRDLFADAAGGAALAVLLVAGIWVAFGFGLLP